jgi:rRNA processing protein Gar1
MSGYQQKRKYAQENEYAAAVDDLTFASAFAMMTTPDATPELSQQKEPITDEIKIDEDDISNESADDEEESLEEAIVELESDDESDIDLSEQLSKMENEDQPKSKNSKIAVPKTQNEIDLYNCPVTELEKKLDLDLGISDVVLFNPSYVGIMNAKVSLDRIRLAGNIKFHLVSDRTIVVESNPNGDADDGTGAGIYQKGSHPGTDNSPLLLDEGSLLLLRLRKDDEIISKLIGDEIEDIDVKPYSDAKVNTIANKTCVIPLGKILEVFGPVSKPLYTVRLTKSLVVQTGNQSNKVVPNLNTKGEDKCSQEVDAMNAKTGDEKKESKADINIDKSARVNANVDASTHPDNAGMEHKAPQTLQDPWSIDGLLTKWVKSMPRLEVYYSKDQCKMMDKQSIVRNSRKACGTYMRSTSTSSLLINQLNFDVPSTHTFV